MTVEQKVVLPNIGVPWLEGRVDYTSQIWYRFLETLYNRTGGASGDFVYEALQAVVDFPNTPHTWTAAQDYQAAVTFDLMIEVEGSEVLLVNNNLSDIINVVSARNNLGLGSAATQNTGTSGATLPFLNGVNTWAAVQTFTVAPVFTAAPATRTALGLGTAATQNTGTSGANVPLLSTANTFGAQQDVQGAVRTVPVAFAALPAAATAGAGARHAINDSLAAPIYNAAAAGGGVVFAGVISNGAAWLYG